MNTYAAFFDENKQILVEIGPTDFQLDDAGIVATHLVHGRIVGSLDVPHTTWVCFNETNFRVFFLDLKNQNPDNVDLDVIKKRVTWALIMYRRGGFDAFH